MTAPVASNRLRESRALCRDLLSDDCLIFGVLYCILVSTIDEAAKSSSTNVCAVLDVSIVHTYAVHFSPCLHRSKPGPSSCSRRPWYASRKHQSCSIPSAKTLIAMHGRTALYRIWRSHRNIYDSTSQQDPSWRCHCVTFMPTNSRLLSRKTCTESACTRLHVGINSSIFLNFVIDASDPRPVSFTLGSNVYYVYAYLRRRDVARLPVSQLPCR